MRIIMRTTFIVYCTLVSLTLAQSGDLIDKAWDIIENNKEKYCLIQPTIELAVDSIYIIKNDAIRISFYQHKEWVPIEDGYFSVYFNSDSTFNHIESYIIPLTNDVDLSRLISKDEALNVINNYIAKRNSEIERIEISRLSIWHYDNSFKPAWQFFFTESNGPQIGRNWWIIDAKTREPWIIDAEWMDSSKGNSFGGYKVIQNAYQYATDHKEKLGLDKPHEQLIPIGISGNFIKNVRFDLYWKGVMVYGKKINFIFDNCNNILYANGTFDPLIKNAKTKPKIKRKRAKEIAINSYKEEFGPLGNDQQSRVDKLELRIQKFKDEYKLVWAMVVYPDTTGHGYFCDIDAITGEVVHFTSTFRY